MVEWPLEFLTDREKVEAAILEGIERGRKEERERYAGVVEALGTAETRLLGFKASVPWYSGDEHDLKEVQYALSTLNEPTKNGKEG
jgi:hypothetical protein